jgi:predicted O-methyltransferase YrrM
MFNRLKRLFSIRDPIREEKTSSLTDDQKITLGKIQHFEEIDGWLSPVEAIELFDLSSTINSVKPIICEIGSWKGRSAYVFASAIGKKGGIVYSIDPFNGEGHPIYNKEIKKMNVSLLENFENTMLKYGFKDCVKIIPMLSKDAISNFPEKRIDLLFIDGNHEYESVKQDFDLWSPLIPSGGTIVLHDVEATHENGPKVVFDKYINNNPSWKHAQVVGSMGIAIMI